MEETSDWRSANYAQAFDGHDRADFAQEFLRRNPGYRDQYAESLTAAPMASQRFAAHWGLAFRDRP